MGNGPKDEHEVQELVAGTLMVMVLTLVATLVVVGGLMSVAGLWGGPR